MAVEVLIWLSSCCAPASLLQSASGALCRPSISLTTSPVPIAIVVGLVCPTIVASLWGDTLGGFIWGGVIARIISKKAGTLLSLTAVLDTSYCSVAFHIYDQFVSRFSLGGLGRKLKLFRLAHWDGIQPYSDETSSRENLVSYGNAAGLQQNADFYSAPCDPYKW